MKDNDIFHGDNKKLAESIEALLALDAKGALVPNGIGEHARTLLSTAVQRLATAEAGIKWEADRNALLLAELESSEALDRAEVVLPRPIRFADLPVVDSLDQLSLGHQIELLRDALDHIARTCHQSRQSTRRIRWIEARANGALEGKPYDAKLLDLPVQVDREIDRLQRRDSRQMARIRMLEAALRKIKTRLDAYAESDMRMPEPSVEVCQAIADAALKQDDSGKPGGAQ